LSKKRKIIVITLIILFIGSVLLVWGQSLLPASSETPKEEVVLDVGLNSHDQSEIVYEASKDTLDKVFGKNKIELPKFRKIAHVVEYVGVGLLFNLLILALGKYDIKTSFWSLSIGLFIGVIDESLQILSKRGPEVYDILVDFLGVLIVTAVFMGVYFIIQKANKKPKVIKEAENEKK